MEEMIRVPVTLYRGGTSKAVFIKDYDLPADLNSRNRLISRLFGSPDKRQIDGLGGADPLTSKLAVIGPPSRPDADVDYTFGQVDILSTRVEYAAVCGNISSAVGPYAIEEGFVRAEEPITTVRIHSTNIKRIIESRVPVKDGKVQVSGDYAIDGVPGTGARIELNWADTVGARTGNLLPTGNPRDVLDVPGVGRAQVSIVDVGNPGVFIQAKDLGLKGTEGPEEIDGRPELIAKCDAIAEAASQRVGTKMRLTFVSAPAPYPDFVTGREIGNHQVDLLVRMIFMGKLHKAFAAAQINCCGTAAVIPGTVVNEVSQCRLTKEGSVRLGHPSGIASLEIAGEDRGGKLTFTRISVSRTARRLLDGFAYVKRA